MNRRSAFFTALSWLGIGSSASVILDRPKSSSVSVPHGFVPPTYTVDLDAAAPDRWNATIEDVLHRFGTEPFALYYTAVFSALQANHPEALTYYRDHVSDFRKVYQVQFPEQLSEADTLADLLRMHASNESERELFSRNQVFLLQMHMQIDNIGTPLGGECTSAVFRRTGGEVAHIRNWDFGPLPDILGSLSVNIDFIFSKTGGQSFRCLMALTHIDKWATCLRPGEFSMSLNARGAGAGHERGRPPAVNLELLRSGRLPRNEILRRIVLSPSYDAALAAAVALPALTSMYTILASSDGRGAVLTLKGNDTSVDVLPLKGPGEDEWFVVQTNVDHWEPMSDVHTSSHRREHVRSLLNNLGPDAPLQQFYGILQDDDVFPAGNTGIDDGRVFRPSTIASVLMRPRDATLSWAADVWHSWSPSRTSWPHILLQ